jgi:hypothetical protein
MTPDPLLAFRLFLFLLHPSFLSVFYTSNFIAYFRQQLLKWSLLLGNEKTFSWVHHVWISDENHPVCSTLSVTESHPGSVWFRAETEETVAHRLFMTYRLQVKKQFSHLGGPWVFWIQCVFSKPVMLFCIQIFVIKKPFFMVIFFCEVLSSVKFYQSLRLWSCFRMTVIDSKCI